MKGIKSMERILCEKLIRDRLMEIKQIYEMYAPEGKYLSLSVVENTISFNNEYFGLDIDEPLNYHEVLEND